MIKLLKKEEDIITAMRYHLNLYIFISSVAMNSSTLNLTLLASAKQPQFN